MGLQRRSRLYGDGETVSRLQDRTLKKVKAVRDLPKVEVSWIDARSFGAWMPRSEARKKKLVETWTVGRLAKNTKSHVVVAQNVNDMDDLSDIILIPKGCVKSIKELSHR